MVTDHGCMFSQAIKAEMPMVFSIAGSSGMWGEGSSNNSDSVISGSLASPTPPEGGDTTERGNETHETESRSHL